MFELTPEKCKELEKAVVDKLCPSSKLKENDPFSDLHSLIAQTAVKAAVQAIPEYEKLKTAEDPL